MKTQREIVRNPEGVTYKVWLGCLHPEASSRDCESSGCHAESGKPSCPLLLTGHSQTAEQVRAGGWRQGVCSCAWFLFSVFPILPYSPRESGAGNVQRPHEILSSRLAWEWRSGGRGVASCPGPPVHRGCRRHDLSL